jgi:hypothetical protein
MGDNLLALRHKLRKFRRLRQRIPCWYPSCYVHWCYRARAYALIRAKVSSPRTSFLSRVNKAQAALPAKGSPSLLYGIFI